MIARNLSRAVLGALLAGLGAVSTLAQPPQPPPPQQQPPDVPAVDDATRYANAKAEIEELKAYNAEIREQMGRQRADLASLNAQLAELDTTSRAVMPLMMQMLAALERFIELDVPFLLDARRAQIAELKSLMSRADVSVSDKYNRLIDAYSSELNYGYEIAAYDGVLGEGGNARTVVFVRLGRVTLLYRTLDGSEVGYWNAASRSWTADNTYAEDVELALRVARSDGAPELLTVPVPAPQEDRL